MDETDNSTPWWGNIIGKVVDGAVGVKTAEINAQANQNNYGSWGLDANGRLVRYGQPNNVAALQTVGGINTTAIMIGLAAVVLLVFVARK